jgi:predicted RND superfamily exporter protein
VDDTLHTLGHLRLQVEREGAAARGEARGTLVGECLGEVAGGHVTSSVLLCLGFAVAASSELLPVSRFGALTALAVAGALAADLLLVPALLAAVSERALRRLAPPR